MRNWLLSLSSALHAHVSTLCITSSYFASRDWYTLFHPLIHSDFSLSNQIEGGKRQHVDRFRDGVEQVEGIFERIGAGVAPRANGDGLRERRGERAKQRAHGERGAGRNVEFG